MIRGMEFNLIEGECLNNSNYPSAMYYSMVLMNAGAAVEAHRFDSIHGA